MSPVKIEEPRKVAKRKNAEAERTHEKKKKRTRKAEIHEINGSSSKRKEKSCEGEEENEIHSHETIKEPIFCRMTVETKKELANSGRAIYCCLPKHIHESRSAALTTLRRHIEKMKPKGIEGIDASGGSFFALLFDNQKHMERGVKKIARSTFKWKGKDINPIARAFGAPRFKVWIIFTNLLTNITDIIQGIVDHLMNLDPDVKLRFLIKKVLSGSIFTGRWAVKLLGKTPSQFSRQITVKTHKFSIIQEPLFCRFCGCSWHTVFECENEGEQTLGSETWNGQVGDIDSSGEEDIENGMAELKLEDKIVHTEMHDNDQKLLEITF